MFQLFTFYQHELNLIKNNLVEDFFLFLNDCFCIDKRFLDVFLLDEFFFLNSSFTL